MSRIMQMLGIAAVAAGCGAFSIWLSPSETRLIVSLSLAVGLAVVLGIELATRIRRGRRSVGRARAVSAKDAVIPPASLPPTGLLIGRERERERLLSYLVMPGSEGPRIVEISGPPGVGKSALALHAARVASGRYGHGVLYASLGAYPSVDPAEILGTFIRSLQAANVPVPSSAAARGARYAQLTGGERRVLVVLDDVRGTASVEMLAPVGRFSALIVTTREPLIQRPDLLKIELAPLSSASSKEVLLAVAGRHIGEDETPALEEIAKLSSGYPLALQVAATSIAGRPDWTLNTVVDLLNRQLGAQPGRSEFEGGLDLTYALLPEQEQLAVRCLGVMESRELLPWQLAALMGVGEPVAWQICDSLVHSRLLERVTDDSTGVAAFVVLDRVFEYAGTRRRMDADEASRRFAQLSRAQEQRASQSPVQLRTTVYRSLERGDPGRALNHARGALAHSRELVATLERAESRDQDELVQAQTDEGLALSALAEVTAELGGFDDVRELVTRAIRTGSKPAKPRALRSLAKIQRRQRRFAEALRTMADAEAAAREIGDNSELIRVHRETAVVRAASGAGKRGLEEIARAWELCGRRSDGGDRLRASLLWAEGIALLANGDDLPRAERVLMDAASHSYARGQFLWWSWITFERARVALSMKRPDAGRRLVLDSMKRFSLMRHRYGGARCRLVLGRSYLDDNSFEESSWMLQEALDTFATCGDRWSEASAAMALAQARIGVGNSDDAAWQLRRAQAIFVALNDQASADDALGLLRGATGNRRPSLSIAHQGGLSGVLLPAVER